MDELDREYTRNGYWFVCVSVLMFLLLFHFGGSQLEEPYNFIMYAKDYTTSTNLMNFSTVVSLNQSEDYTPYKEDSAACYLMNTLFTAKDSCGENDGTLYGFTSNNGTCYGGVTIEDGAMKFDGVDDRIQISTSSLSVSQGTISMWFKIPTNYIPPENEFLFGHYNSGNRIYIMNNADDSALRLQIGNGEDFYSVGGWNDGEWHHVVMYWNGSEMGGYLDSEPFGNVSYSGLSSLASGCYIGDQPTAGGGEFNGSIDDVRIYNRALTAEEVQAEYLAGRESYAVVSDGLVAQYSGKDYAGTASAPTTIYDTNQMVSGAYYGSTALKFDGVDDSVSTTMSTSGVFDGNVEFSAFAWVKDNSAVGDPTGYILSNNASLVASRTSLLSASYDGTFRVYVGGTIITSGRVIRDGVWHHVGVSVYNDSGTMKANLYFDGVRVVTGATAGTNTATGTVIIGALTPTQEFFNGSIDDVRIYNRSLTAEEIQNIYNSTSLVHYYSTTTGIINTSISSESKANITYLSEDYVSRTYTDVNTDTAHTAYLWQAELHLNLTDISNGSSIEGYYVLDDEPGTDIIYQNTTQVSTGSETYVVVRNISMANASNLYMIEGYYTTDYYNKYVKYEVILNNGTHYNSSEYLVDDTGYANYMIPVIGFPVSNILVWGHRVGAGINFYSNNITVYGWNSSTTDTLYLTAGNHSVYVMKTPYYPQNLTIELTALENATEDIEMFTNEIWLYGTRSHVLENFTCTYNGTTMYSNPYQISNINDPTANMTCTKAGFKPANVSPSTVIPINESFYLDELTTTSFPIYIYDEITLANVTNATLYVFGEEPYVFNWNSTDRTISINGSGVTGMLFRKTGYNDEEYYVDIGEVYGSIDVYMLPTNSSINASFNLQDRVNVPIGGGFIDIYKFYPELVSYVRVSTYRTDDNGNATIYWEADKFYKVNTRSDFSDTMYEAIDFPFTPASTKYNVKYGLTDSERNSAFVFLNMDYNLSYTVNGLNQTIFSLTFNDLSGVVVSACLNVIEQGVSRDITLCENCLTASAGEILCVINESDYVNTLSAWGTFETSTTFSPKNTPRLDVPKDPQYLDLGAGGLFVTFILTATGLIAGLFISVPVGLMFLVATLILAMATGLFWMQISSIVSLAILILLIIFKR